MDVAVVPATPTDAPVLDRLQQLSAYDFSEYGGIDVDSDGLFRPADDEEDDVQDPVATFLVWVDGHLAGYAVVGRHASYFDHVDNHADTGSDGAAGRPHIMSNFFVLRRYRRRGVGEHVARTLFNRFPGRWEVATNPGREPAQTFWRRIIGRYTAGTHWEAAGCERWPGLIWAFESTTDGTVRTTAEGRDRR